MSTNEVPSDRKLNLEQQKKRAKELLRDLRRGSEEAAGRLIRHLPRTRGLGVEQVRASGASLSEAQLVIARENGFRSWPRLKHHIEQQALSAHEAEEQLITAALGGNQPVVRALLERDASLARASIYAAATLGEVDAVQRFVERDIKLATAPGGPRGWTPLLYALSARLNDNTVKARLRIAELLLDHGADPNDGAPVVDSLRGYRTALGAAVGCARSPRLVEMLLDAGADPADGPTLWEGSAMWEAVRHRDVESLRLQLEAGPPQWLTCHALPMSLQREQPEMVRLLLAHGADPDGNKTTWSFGGTALHEAIVLGRSAEILEALLAAGADPQIEDRDGRTPYAVAVRIGHEAAKRLLAERGADLAPSQVDRWLAACWQADDEAASKIRPPREDLRHSDHQWPARAVRWDNAPALPLLLAGCSPDVADDDGQAPLHLAALRGDRDSVQRLLDAGASLEARNFADQTPLQCAVSAARGNRRDLVELLLQRGADASAVSRWQDLPAALEQRLRDGGAVERDLSELFERAADAVVNGDLERLRELLREEPTLVTQRSPRAHRATLLHYLGANGVEDERQRTPKNAVEVMTCLLEAGADPDALCYTYRGGPGQTTFGLLVSSGHPAEAGLTLPLVRTLRRHGADVPPGWTLLAALSEDGEAEGATQEALDAALREAAALGAVTLTHAVLARGANVNAADARRVTALHRAALGGWTDVVEALLTAGADTNLRDATHGGTAAGWAAAGGHETLAQRLAGC